MLKIETFLNESPAFICFINNVSYASDLGVDDLIVSTYQLNNDDLTTRTGSVYLFSTTDLSVQRKIPTNSGVFRFEMIPNSTKIIASLTNGRLTIVDVKLGAQNLSEILSEGILLDVSWNSLSNKVICSDDYGELFLIDAESFILDRHWMSHKSKYGLKNCEVWSCCWLSNHIAASGAEDGEAKIWDLRSKNHLQKVNKSHKSGVTFIEKCEDNKNFLITGSYDENVRLFDLRNFENPIYEHKLNGGIWHVEKMAGDKDLYLAACMYGGWNIVSKSNLSFKTLHTFSDTGESLLYGVSSQQISDQKYRIASCTFNDKHIRLYDITVST